MPNALERPLPGPQGYKRLVRILARTFYAGECPPREEEDGIDGTNQHHQYAQSQDHLPTTTNNNNPAAPYSSKLSKPPPRNPKQDTTGLGILLLDYLCSNKVGGYVEEVTIASDLRLSQKNIRKALRHLETERLVSSESVKISIRRQNAQLPDDAEVEERKRQETRVFWCLDYPRLRDSLQLRIYAVKDLLHKRISESVPIQEYLCTSCGAVYSSLDAPRLIDPRSGVFRCEEEMCGYELIPKIDGAFGSNGGNNSSTTRRDAEAYFKDVQRRLEAQLAPLVAQLDHLKDTMPPDYGTLQDWYQRHKEAHERRQKRLEAARKRAGDAGMNMSEEELLDWVDRAEVAVDFGGGGGGGGGVSKNGEDGDGEADGKGGVVKDLPVWFQHDAIYGGGGGGGSVQISQEVGSGSKVLSGEEAEGAEIERKKLEQAYLQQYLAQVEAAKASVQVDFDVGGDGGEEDGEGGRKRVKLEEKEEEKEEVKVEHQEGGDEEEELLWEDV